MSGEKWYSQDTYAIVCDYVQELAFTNQIGFISFKLAVYLCKSANFTTGEVVVKSTTFLAEAIGTHQKNVTTALNELERVKFLLRDSGYKNRSMNRYKIFCRPELYTTNYVFQSEQLSNNKASLTDEPKKSGEVAVPKPEKTVTKVVYTDDTSVMEFSYNYLNWYFNNCPAFDELAISEKFIDPTTTLSDFHMVRIDRDMYFSFKSFANRNNLPFPEKFSSTQSYLFDSVDWDRLEQRFGELPFDMFA